MTEGKGQYFSSKDFGLRVKELRKQRNMTQKELSDRLDMDDGSLRRIEAGRTNPTLETINKICKAFNTPVWTLFAPTQINNEIPSSAETK